MENHFGAHARMRTITSGLTRAHQTNCTPFESSFSRESTNLIQSYGVSKSSRSQTVKTEQDTSVAEVTGQVADGLGEVGSFTRVRPPADTCPSNGTPIQKMMAPLMLRDFNSGRSVPSWTEMPS